ncbi:MAG TPA: hypothetical protein VF066_14000 [Thermoleophilaceae bacterium]
MEASTEYSAASNGSSQSPWAAHEAAESVGRPEIPVIGAFVGGFVLAKLLKALGGDDD